MKNKDDQVKPEFFDYINLVLSIAIIPDINSKIDIRMEIKFVVNIENLYGFVLHIGSDTEIEVEVDFGFENVVGI